MSVKAIENLDPVEVERAVSFNIKMFLTAKGLTQTELGAALGIKRAAMSQKMRNDTAWSLADLVNAAKFLNVSLNDLFSSKFSDVLMESTSSMNTEPRMFVASDDSLSAPPGTRTLNPRLKRTLL